MKRRFFKPIIIDASGSMLRKWLRRAIYTVIIILSAGLMVIISHAWYNKKYGRMYWRDIALSESVELHGFQDYKFRVYNHNAGKYTTPKIYWIRQSQQGDSLAVYAIPHKRGYINVKNGKIVIDAELNDYQRAWVFSEGVAAVMRDDKIGFINAENEVVIPFIFSYNEECRIEDFPYVFHGGFCAMTGSNGKVGLIDKSGNWVLEPTYDKILSTHGSGYRIIVNNGKHGVITDNGTTVYPTEHEYINIVSNGFILTKDGKKWQEDFEGNVIQPFMFDSTAYLNYPIGYNEYGDTRYGFSEYAKYAIMNRYGIMNRTTGKPITLAIYSEINMLSEELFEVQEYDSKEWYLVNSKGNAIPYDVK